jgi:tripartite-type tricarboxylate transporter receptor subunit TctC
MKNFIFLILTLLSVPALASETIKVTVGYGAGGGTDYVARILTKDAEIVSGTTFIVENRSGANGVIALRSYFQKNENNHLVAVSGGQILYEPIVNPQNNFLQDLKVIGPVLKSPLIIVSHPESKIKNINFLFDKSVPGQVINVATAGESHQFLIDLISKHSHHDIQEIRHKGTGESFITLAGKHVDLMIAELAFFKPREVSVNYIASASSTEIGNIPLLKKYVPEAILINFFGIAAKTHQDTEIIEKNLRDGFVKENRKGFFENQGYIIDMNPNSDFIQREVLPSYQSLIRSRQRP